MNKLTIFDNEQFGEIRTLVIDNEPWFVGKDVARALGYSNTKSAIADHVDIEDKQLIQRSGNTTLEIPNRGLTFINESGVDLEPDIEEQIACFYMKNWRKMNNSILEVLDETGFLDK